MSLALVQAPGSSALREGAARPKLSFGQKLSLALISLEEAHRQHSDTGMEGTRAGDEFRQVAIIQHYSPGGRLEGHPAPWPLHVPGEILPFFHGSSAARLAAGLSAGAGPAMTHALVVRGAQCCSREERVVMLKRDLCQLAKSLEEGNMVSYGSSNSLDLGPLYRVVASSATPDAMLPICSILHVLFGKLSWPVQSLFLLCPSQQAFHRLRKHLAAFGRRRGSGHERAVYQLLDVLLHRLRGTGFVAMNTPPGCSSEVRPVAVCSSIVWWFN